MGINGTPFLVRVVFIIMLSALIRGMDGIYGIFFGEMIPFHDPVDPILHIGADKQVDDVISGAQGIIAAASYDDAGAFPGKRFNDGLHRYCPAEKVRIR